MMKFMLLALTSLALCVSPLSAGLKTDPLHNPNGNRQREFQKVFSHYKNYIEFQYWQAIVSSNGIYVVHDKIYLASIMGYDDDFECYYIPADSEIVEFESLKRYPELQKKIDQIMKSISHQ